MSRRKVNIAFLAPPADDRLIRLTHRREGDTTVLSLYFRYPPQKMDLTGKQETATLLLDIFTGNPLSARYPELVTQPSITPNLQEVTSCQTLQLYPAAAMTLPR